MDARTKPGHDELAAQMSHSLCDLVSGAEIDLDTLLHSGARGLPPAYCLTRNDAHSLFEALETPRRSLARPAADGLGSRRNKSKVRKA